jgi:hypothetical protein
VTSTWVGPVAEGGVQHLFSVVGRGEAAGEGGVYAAPLGENAAALRLPELAIAVAGRYADIDAELAVIAEDHLYGLGLTKAREFFSSDAAVEMFWDFVSGEAVLVSVEPCNIRIALNSPDALLVDSKTADVSVSDGMISIALAEGEHHLAGAVPASLEANRQWLTSTVSEAMAAFEKEAGAPEDSSADLPRLVAESTFDCGEKVVDLIQLPLDDGPLLAAASGTTIHVFTEQGGLLKKMECDGPIRMLRWWAEARLLLAGCVDEKVIAFSETGERAWVFVSEMDPAVFRAAKTYWFKSAPGHEGIHGLHTGVFLDGKSQAFVGSACTLEIIDEKGQLVKRMPQFWGKVSLFKIIPTAENTLTLLAGRKYNGWNSLGVIHNTSLDPDTRGFHSVPKGHTSIGGWSSMNRHHLFFEDFDGDGEKEVLSEINGSWNRVTVWDKHGVAEYDASFGPGKRIPAKNMRDIDTADLDGDGVPEIVVAESTGIIVALTGTCERIWGTNVSGSPMVMNCVTPADCGTPVIVVGNADGAVNVLDNAGAPLSVGSVTGAPSFVLPLGGGKVALATEKGEVVLFGL